MGKSRNHHKDEDEIEENIFVRKKKWYEEDPEPFQRPRKPDKFEDIDIYKLPIDYWD